MSGEKFGRYEVREEIGDGAMGRVYRAWDPSVSRIVALKTVKSEYLTRETRDEYLRRFRREAQAAGALNHPCIVRVFDVGENYLVMEFVEGRTLQTVIREDGRFSPEGALRLLGPVAQAVDHAHRSGIVHRDIKPANIMVQPNGLPKLMDFGVAHLEASVMTTAGQILGSPSYMAPEQLAGQEVTGRSDVYSLAIVAYEMLAGQPPFQGTITQVIYRVMNEPPAPPRQWNVTLPPRYDEVFAKALEKDPARRFATASEFVSALDLREIEFTLTPLSATATPATAMPAAAAPAAARTGSTPPADAAASPRAASRARLIGAGVGLALLLGAGALLVLRRGASLSAGSAAPATTTSAPSSNASAPEPTPSVSPAVPSPSEAPTTTAPSAVPAAASPSPAETSAVPSPSAAPRRPARPRATPTPAPVVEGQLVELGPDVTPPRKTVSRTVPIPEVAKRLRLNGTVAIGFVIDEHGVPTDVAVVESAGSVLDATALESVRGWRYEPARKDGVKVKVRWVEKLTYRLGP